MADGGYGSKKQLSMFCEFVLIAGNQKSFLLELNESRVLISQIKLPMEQNRGMRPNESSLRMSTISEDEVAPLFVTQERELAAVGWLGWKTTTTAGTKMKIIIITGGGGERNAFILSLANNKL